MRNLFAVALFLFFSAAAAALEDGIPLETLARIKDATACTGMGLLRKL